MKTRNSSRRRAHDGAARDDLDRDLEAMSRERLLAEAKALRQGIRAHRDSTLHELCWHHPALWSLLPEKTDPLPEVPAWPRFLAGCIRYRESLDRQAPDAPRSEIPYPGTAPAGGSGSAPEGRKKRMKKSKP